MKRTSPLKRGLVSVGCILLAGTGCGGEPVESAPAPAETVTQAATSEVVATADTFVRSDDTSPGTDRGGWNYLSVRGGTPSQVAYLKFNLAGYSGSVASAKLRLYCYDSAACAGTVIAKQVADDSWQDTMTWLNRKPVGASISSVTVVAPGAVEVDLTGFVNTQLAGDKVVSIALESPDPGIKFRALEHTVASERPVLRVDQTAAWWKRYFVSGKSRYMGRPWNVGYTFYNTANGDQTQWISYMGG